MEKIIKIIQGLEPFAIIIFIFWVFREVVLWYWKINKHIELQEKILFELQKANKIQLARMEHKNKKNPSSKDVTDKILIQ